MKKEKGIRFIVQLDGVELGRSTNLIGIANIIGCSNGWIYREIKDGKLKLNKKVYTIIDRLA